MKNIKVIVALFVATLCIGGLNHASAGQTYTMTNLKADFLQDTPHYTGLVTKKTDSTQKVKITSTTANRQVLLAEFNEKNEAVGGYTYTSFSPGQTKKWDDAVYQLKGKRKIRAKLPLPWTQVTINGVWYIDL